MCRGDFHSGIARGRGRSLLLESRATGKAVASPIGVSLEKQVERHSSDIQVRGVAGCTVLAKVVGLEHQ